MFESFESFSLSLAWITDICLHIIPCSEEFQFPYKNIFTLYKFDFKFFLVIFARFFQLFIVPYEEECGSSCWVEKRGSRSSDVSEVASFVGMAIGSGLFLRYITPTISTRNRKKRKGKVIKTLHAKGALNVRNNSHDLLRFIRKKTACVALWRK